MGNMLSTLEHIRYLTQVPPGAYYCGAHRKWWKFWKRETRGGWLLVDHDQGQTNIMWTSHRDYHDALGDWGSALSVSIHTKHGIIVYLESEISFWVKWGYGQGTNVELRDAENFVNWAYQKLCVEKVEAQ